MSTSEEKRFSIVRVLLLTVGVLAFIPSVALFGVIGAIACALFILLVAIAKA